MRKTGEGAKHMRLKIYNWRRNGLEKKRMRGEQSRDLTA